jgi:glycosyltransferase involved in cell wall biosynthesis
MLTVLIATYNGAKTLPEALSAYCQVQAPRGGWKLVIVDNGSADATKEIIHSFMDRLPLSYLFELSRGKNAALNTGLASIEGDLVVLTDDDILPRFDWLKELRHAADSHASFSVFGGAVIPHWEIRPEEWILAWVKLAPVFGCTDPSWEEGPVIPGHIFGGNMAIRTKVFEAGYRFNPDIGPRGSSYAMGSETDLTMRLGKSGINAWHCKQAVVEHMVRKFQMTRAWIFSRALRFGRGEYRLEFQHQYANRKKYLGIPRRLIKEAVKEGLKAGRAQLRGDKAQLFAKRWAFNYLLGQMIEAWLIHKELQSNRAVQGLPGHFEKVTNQMPNVWDVNNAFKR